MPEIADLIKETTATTGTVLSLTLIAETNYGRFADAFAADTSVYYVIRSGNDTEVGEGITRAGNVLERTTPLVTMVAGVYDNTVPARINLAGVSTVAMAPNAATILAKAPLAGATFTGDVTVPNLITAGNVDGRDVSVDGTKLDGIATSANNYSHPNHTGDVTSTGDGATVIAANAVTLAKMADMATASLLGRNTAGTGDPEVLSAATVRSLLGLVIGTDVQPYDATLEIGATKTSRKNFIINGGFDRWRRGTTFNSLSNAGYSSERWLNIYSGTAPTVNVTQQSFTLGQTDVPNEPEHYLRYEATNVTGTTALTLAQRVESARTLAGEQVTLSFYMKANVAATLGIVRLRQSFGTGGSGAQNSDMSVDSTAITTVWKKFTATVTIAGISGETIAGGDDYLQLQIFLPIEINTVDIAQVQLEKGSVATDFEYRHIGEELALCQRFFKDLGDFTFKTGVAGSGFSPVWDVAFSEMRATPTVSFTLGVGCTNVTVSQTNHVRFQGTAAESQGRCNASDVELDAEL